MRIRTNQFYFAIAFLVSLCALPVSAQGRSTVGDYANRLAQAERAVNETLERNSPASELAPLTSEVKRLLPASEEVEFNGAITRVDNAWLHEAMNNVAKTAEGDAERRLPLLGEISARLARLRQSVKAAQTAEDPALQDQRARLDNILARPEYQSEEKRESAIARWIRQMMESIARLLMKLFGGSSARAPQTGGAGLVLILRALLFLVVIAALIFGAVKLARRFQARQKPAEEAETREALGEVIAEDATAADLFAMASDLARQGEYRKAIRRAYIALLCDFDQRGKLRLGRSKTNRDYLDAMRSEQRIYPTFSVMTFAFERAWYGQERATEEEFQNFVTLYQEAIQ
ncbi:MAG TPA: DUF4129 domain-containing protein [Blastocatellia bacterium]|nr:DUF4129 domain-containing protein [Blastocatellia bacterium]